jgi:hypothetical protein
LAPTELEPDESKKLQKKGLQDFISCNPNKKDRKEKNLELID